MMDKKIKQIQKLVAKDKVKTAGKRLKELEAEDHKRDRVCDYGKKMMKKKKK